MRWLAEHVALHRALRAARRELAAVRRALTISDSKYRALQHLVRCAAPAEHLRLAHRLHVAEARLAEIEGIDPHRASLEPVPLEVEA